MYMNIRIKKEGLDLKQLTEDLGEEYINDNNSDDAYNQMSDDRDDDDENKKKNNKNGVIV